MSIEFVTCTLEDENCEYSVIAEVHIEPAQDGGLTDPSWDASWYVYGVRNKGGIDILECLSVDDAELINQQVIQHFEDFAKD